MILKIQSVLPRIICCLILLLFCSKVFPQIEGKVTDSKNSPLSAVNVYLENSYLGTTTNDEGQYVLQITKPGSYVLIFQYLGFQTVKKQIDITQFPFVVNMVLEEESVSLAEVSVRADYNPANDMIRKTIENRKKINNKTKNYTADFYSRGLIRIKDAPEKILGQSLGDFGGGLDSTRSGIIYLSETISKITQSEKNDFVEKIIASKVSGDDNGFSFNNASDVNYNYYKNTTPVGETEIVSPIAEYAFTYYSYKYDVNLYDT